METPEATATAPEAVPESNLVPFPQTSGIATDASVSPMPEAPVPVGDGTEAEPFNLDTLPNGTPILFSKHEISKAILAVQEARGLIGASIANLAETQKWTNSPQYKALHERIKSAIAVLDSAYAYAGQSHETIFLVLSTANVANGITKKVEIKETVQPTV